MTPGSAGSTPKSDGWKSIGYQVDPEKMHWLQNIPTKEGCKEDGEDLSHIGRQEVLDGFLDI